MRPHGAQPDELTFRCRNAQLEITMTLDVIVLWIGALGFTLFGVLLLVRPRGMSRVGIPADNADARCEIRAMYGGLELGAAGFLGLCILRPELTEAGLWFQLLALGGLALGRLLGISVERGGVSRLIWLFAALEITAALLTTAALALRTYPA
ncbi:MAG: DUF4345 family protein [Gemmatimonadota bacterium]